MTTLILLPGLACDGALWRDQLPALCGAGWGARVSDVHTRCDSLPQMAATLLSEAAGDLILAGCSMGGMLALEMARQAPHRLRGLALLGTSARPDTPELIELRTQACAMFADGLMDDVLAANVAFAFHRLHAQDGTLRADYLAMIHRAGPQQLIRQNRAVMARADMRPSLAALRMPTLVVCGEDDRLAPPECSRELAAGIAGARLEWLSPCGHMLTWEQPAALNALLLGWLQDLRDATGRA